MKPVREPDEHPLDYLDRLGFEYCRIGRPEHLEGLYQVDVSYDPAGKIIAFTGRGSTMELALESVIDMQRD